MERGTAPCQAGQPPRAGLYRASDAWIKKPLAGSAERTTFAAHFEDPMYAIVDIAGQQFKVKAGQKLKV
ncbi:MAG TPA: hypothetical protein PL106_09665, partial [Flavobacteriales bacterium]|nr:hypothetical protein [Flavobacteriales bacterium]